MSEVIAISTHGLTLMDGVKLPRGWFVNCTMPCTSGTFWLDSLVTGTVQREGFNPKRLQQVEVIVLICEAESIRARIVWQPPTVSRKWTRAVPSSTVGDCCRPSMAAGGFDAVGFNSRFSNA